MKGRRQFVVDGNVIIGRPVKDQEFPIPWFERRIHTPHTEVFSEFEKKKQKQLYSRPEYSIEANISLLDLTKKNKAFEIADQKARMSALHDSASKTKTEDSRIQNKKNFEVLRRKQPSYSIPAASRMAPHNVLDGPSPGPKYRPLSPSGYRHFSTSVTGATFGTASREIANLIRKEHWENRWRPLRISWAEESKDAKVPAAWKHLTLPQQRRSNVRDHFGYNSALGGSFNQYIRPSTKRSSKILRNEARIVESRKNIWKSLRYQESMHLPRIVMRRLKESKVKLSNEQRRIKKI
jgi:hypothetical protein